MNIFPDEYGRAPSFYVELRVESLVNQRSI